MSPGLQPPLIQTPTTQRAHLDDDPTLQASPELNETHRMPTSRSFDQASTPTSNEATPDLTPTTSVSTPVAMPGMSRPTRNRKQRLFYDAHTGSYVSRNPGNEFCD